MRNLVLADGVGHDFPDMAAALAGILGEAGIASEVSSDIEAGLARLDAERFDLVTVQALRWRMLESAKWAPLRDRLGFSLSAAGRSRLEAHLAGGGGLLALHTAAICFDDWPGWREIVGAAWVWNSSFHPPLGPVEVRPAPRRHSVTEGVEPFALAADEVYTGMDMVDGIEPLLLASASRTDAAGRAAIDQPVLWLREHGGGRVAFDALGHDRASLEAPMHARVLRRAALWAAGRL